MAVVEILKCFRFRQWTKNLLVFAALIFSGNAFQPSLVLHAAAGFLLFSLTASAVYTLNDIIDRHRDRGHPLKKSRPFAAGRVPIVTGWAVVAVLLGAALVLSYLLEPLLSLVLGGYVCLQLVYSLWAKNIVILDVFIISFGFVLRVVAGAVTISVEISSWILVCTMLLALFLAMSKRRHELTLLGANAHDHRAILREYSPYLLDQMIGVVTAATVVAYLVFTLSAETTAKFGSGMVFTVPFVLYGIFRYLYLVHCRDAGGRPEETLLSDIPLQLTIVLYGLVSLVVIYYV